MNNSRITLEQLEQASLEALKNALAASETPQQVIMLIDSFCNLLDRIAGGDDPRLWTTEDAARFIGCQPDTVRKWASQQRIPHIKIGSLTRFEPSRLRKWLLSRETKVHKAWR